MTRRGSAYVLVLACIAIATAAGIAGLAVRGAQVESAVVLDARAEAALAARSALELAVARIEADSDWRTMYASGVVVAARPLADATVSVTAVGIEGDIADGPVRLTTTAETDAATQTASIVLTEVSEPINGLDSSAATLGALTFDRVTFRGDRPARGRWVNGSSSNVDTPIEADSSISGGNYRDTQTTGVPVEAHQIQLLGELAAAATPVFSGSPSDIDGAILGPGINTITPGQTSSTGLYVIDCQWRRLTIANLRVHGTLILRNNLNLFGSRLEDGIHIEPLSPDMPALVTDGSLTIELGTRLDEKKEDVNFNPVGLPLDGDEDNDETDEHDSEIRGPIIANGWIKVEDDLVMRGPIISYDSIEFEQCTVVVTDDPAIREDPHARLTKGSTIYIDPTSYRN